MALYSYELVTRYHQLQALLPPWKKAFGCLPVAQQVVTVGPEWSLGLWFRFGPNRGFRCLVIHHNHELVMVLPYLLQGTPSKPKLHLCCELLPLFSGSTRKQAFQFLFEVLGQLHPHFQLFSDHMDDSHLTTQLFFQVAAEHYLVKEARSYSHTEVVLKQGWDGYWSQLSKNTKEGLRKARARVRKHHIVTSYFCAAKPDDIPKAVAFGLGIDAMSWKFERGGALCRDHHEDSFFKLVLEALANQDKALVFGLSLNDQPVAFIFAFLQGREAYFSIWSFAEMAAYFMPGKLLMAYALEHLAGLGIERVDFWGRHDAFKASWSKQTMVRKKLWVGSKPSFLDQCGAAIASTTSKITNNRVIHFLVGGSERYRLKVDQPGWVQRSLVNPMRTRITFWREQSRFNRFKPRGELRTTTNITLERETPKHRFFLGWRPFQPGETAWVFLRDQELLGGMVTVPFPSEKSVRVTALVFLTEHAELKTDCLITFFKRNPRITSIYEEACKPLQTKGETLGQYLNVPAEVAQKERVGHGAH